jgi:hypothetical protein
MQGSAAANWACATLCLLVCGIAAAWAQPATPEDQQIVIAPVDWTAVRAQLAARTDNRLRKSGRDLRSLIPPGYSAARSFNARPRIPVLIPIFQGSTESGGRSLSAEERNFLPVTQQNGNGSGGRSAPAAAQQPQTLVFPETNAYAATIKLPQGATVTINGASVARQLLASDSAARVLARTPGENIGRYQMSDVVTEQTETGFGISFTRFGVAYNIEIGCTHFTDARCQSEDFVRELAFSMGLVGDPPPAPAPP